LPKNGD